MLQLPSLLFKYNKGSFDHILERRNPRCKRMFKAHLINALHGSKIFKIEFLKINEQINLFIYYFINTNKSFPKTKEKNPFVDGSNFGLLWVA